MLVSRNVKFIESKGYYEEQKWDNMKDLSQTPSDKATNLRIVLETLGIDMSENHESKKRVAQQHKFPN